jgi:2-alkenal reductase
MFSTWLIDRFAIPVDVVNRVVPKLFTNCKLPRPGIGIIVLDEEVAAGLGVEGVVIDRVVPGSEVNHVGSQGIDYRNRILGNIIVAVDDQEVKNIDLNSQDDA